MYSIAATPVPPPPSNTAIISQKIVFLHIFLTVHEQYIVLTCQFSTSATVDCDWSQASQPSANPGNLPIFMLCEFIATPPPLHVLMSPPGVPDV